MSNPIHDKFVNKKIERFNTDEKWLRFRTKKELWDFVARNDIKDMQEFWFFIAGEDILFCSVFQYTFEG